MRILVLSFHFPPDLSAGSFRTEALIEALEPNLPEKSSIDVLTTFPNRYTNFGVQANEYQKKKNVKISRVALKTPSNGILNQDGHVRFVYFNPSNSLKSEIDIYDFSMNHVINLSQKIIIEDEATIIWNGRNRLGSRVVNGTYFCRLSIDNKEYWTKLLVIN